MMVLFWYTLSLLCSLSPSFQPLERHGQLATAISQALIQGGPLYANDVTLERSAALMVAVAFRESSLTLTAVGDGGKSFCAFQIHSSSGGTRELLEDPLACAARAHALMKASIQADRAHPLAQYARGPGFKTLEAQRLSNDRVALANRLYFGTGRQSP
jgi:hypothetical protein